MVTPDQALSSLPDGLRGPLIVEFNDIINNFMESKWTASELSAGRFCEIVDYVVEL